MLTTARYSVFGITILQVYIYLRNSGPDSPRMKAFVSRRVPSEEHMLTSIWEVAFLLCVTRALDTALRGGGLTILRSMLDTVSMVLTIQVLYEMVVSKFAAPLSEIMQFPR